MGRGEEEEEEEEGGREGAGGEREWKKRETERFILYSHGILTGLDATTMRWQYNTKMGSTARA